MANIKDLKKKIKSTKSTLKITTAMKLVSAAKLNRAQQAILSARPYSEELKEMIQVISALNKDYSHPLLEKKDVKKSLLLVISSDKGLCGGYNSQLSKEVKRFISGQSESLEVRFIGKKVRELTSSVLGTDTELYTFDKPDPSFEDMRRISNELSGLFNSEEVGAVYIAYNKFNSAISFTPMIKQVLPIGLDNTEVESLREKYPFDFKYTPGPESILNTLIPESYISSVYSCLLDAAAAEHGSRMSSMDSASKNCKEAIRQLTLKMNKLRQAAITTELIEVVSGAESLNG